MKRQGANKLPKIIIVIASLIDRPVLLYAFIFWISGTARKQG